MSDFNRYGNSNPRNQLKDFYMTLAGCLVTTVAVAYYLSMSNPWPETLLFFAALGSFSWLWAEASRTRRDALVSMLRVALYASPFAVMVLKMRENPMSMMLVFITQLKKSRKSLV
ncbi:MAG: hypothetical protein IJ523_01215 [Succinivibrionaceae bacterium]|nr:hypothetical protein [Succinivibrionaceae bacterium]